MMNHKKRDTKTFRGLIHIHTTYSYDGTLSLTDFIQLAKNRHYEFIVLTEHAEDFDDTKMQIFVNECSKSTQDNFLVIPGLEFNIDGIHILGVGLGKIIHENDPEELIRKIHEDNGLAILAHTEYYKNVPYEKLKDIDLIEIWNPRYGERLAPSIKSLKIMHKFRTMKKTFIASGGLDLHKPEDLLPLYQDVSADRLTQTDILDSLRRGEFITTKGFIRIYPLNDPTITMNALIYLCAFMQFVPNITKKIVKKIYKMFKFLL